MPPESNPNKHRIIAIDPGVTTGICEGLLDIETKTLHLEFKQERFTISQFYWHVRQYISIVMEGHVHVIYESFEYRNAARAGLDLTPVKLIGIIELLEEWYTDVKFYKQSASTGKAFYRDDRLKNMGVYAVGLNHSRDATRHLLQWLTFGAGSQYVPDLEEFTLVTTRAT